MSHEAARAGQSPLTRFEQLRFAREVLRTESQAIVALADQLDDTFCDAVDCVLAAHGSVIVTGMGKAGLVGQKIAATLASTGTRSHFLHPAEAIHGDLGRVGRDDVVMMLSFSGETEEITRLLPHLTTLGAPIIAITGAPRSTLGQAATHVLDLGPLREACNLGLAPSTSTTAMLALGDALALVLSRQRGFRQEDFARFHPGGSLGRKMAKVEEVMRPLDQCRVSTDSVTIRQMLVQVSRPGRRTGAIMLTDENGRLAGLFTDSDLARLLETPGDASLDKSVSEVMSRRCSTVCRGTKVAEAVKLLAARKISELPVVDEQQRPVGLIDITDVVGLWEREPAADESPQSTKPDSHEPRIVLFPARNEHQPPADT
ncbi:MAG: KpsF/GutQ family sugar-phosphate isomerase [Planctomycetales bacterium]|nr:KpsF/GutQ family sugar-phosphate isomerase [Planctomycetales bacterium]